MNISPGPPSTLGGLRSTPGWVPPPQAPVVNPPPSKSHHCIRLTDRCTDGADVRLVSHCWWQHMAPFGAGTLHHAECPLPHAAVHGLFPTVVILPLFTPPLAVSRAPFLRFGKPTYFFFGFTRDRRQGLSKDRPLAGGHAFDQNPISNDTAPLP